MCGVICIVNRSERDTLSYSRPFEDWGGWWGRRKWDQVPHKGKVLKKLGPCNLNSQELRVEMET